MARLMSKNATVTSSQVVDLTVADDLTVTDALTAATIDASTDFTIGGLVVTDGQIADTGTLAIVPVDGCTIALGTDAGDDFNVDSGKFLVEGDTGLVSIGTGGDFETSTTGKVKQKEHSCNQVHIKHLH